MKTLRISPMRGMILEIEKEDLDIIEYIPYEGDDSKIEGFWDEIKLYIPYEGDDS